MHTSKKKKQKNDNKKSTSHFQNKQEGWNPFQTHKESAFQCRRHKRCVLNPWVRTSPWRREWLHIPVFLPGKFHRQRSLESYSPWGRKESNTTEHTHRHTHTNNQKSRQEPKKKKTIKYKYTRHFQWFSQTVLKDTGLQCILHCLVLLLASIHHQLIKLLLNLLLAW